MTQDFIYLDYNATTPIDPRVARAMEPALHDLWGNPSSAHRLGIQARRAVDRSRAQVAKCLGAAAHEIYFTSGGTESNNLAIGGVLRAQARGHVITSAVEHPAVLEVVRAWEADGRCALTLVEVDSAGRVAPRAVERAIRPDTVLVSVMLANNEVGTVEPLAEIAALCHERGVLVHTDAAQAVGKIPVDVSALGVDLLSVAGHKLYAPKGVGALYAREGVSIAPILFGAAHEGGLRPGTENLLEILGLGAACDLVHRDVAHEVTRLSALRDRLRAGMQEHVDGLRVHGPLAEGANDCLPNTLSVVLPGATASDLVTRLADRIALSAGAACHADSVQVSHVLAAMDVPVDQARATVRLSVGRFTTEAEVDRAVRDLSNALQSAASL